MFIQHVIISAIVCLGIGFVITKTMAWENTTTRDNSKYLDNFFWEQNPTNGDIFDALYSGQTAYTRYMSGYNFQNNSCNKQDIKYQIYTWGNQFTFFPEVITGNTIIVLSSGTYVNMNSKIILSGNCIALLGSGKVTFWGIIQRDTSSKYTIIDNITHNDYAVISPDYTTQTWISLQIVNSWAFYSIEGDIVGNTLSGILYDIINHKAITLTKENNINNIDLNIFDIYNHINHFNKTIVHDSIFPTLTSVIVSTNAPIQSWWIYNTSIKIEGDDTNLSWITNNGIILNWTSTVVNAQWIYKIQVSDKAGNNTGISFEIDTTPPAINIVKPASGEKIESPTLQLSWITQENTARIFSQIYKVYSGFEIISSWTVTPWITNVTVDTILNGTYKRQIIIQDTAGNIATGEASNIKFTKVPSIFSTIHGYSYANKRYTNNDPTITFSGNKNFSYEIYTGSTGQFLVKTGKYLWSNITESVYRGWISTWDAKVTLKYTTLDQETGAIVIDFFIDKIVPSTILTPSRKGKTNIVTPLTYIWTVNKPDTMIKYYNFLMNGAIVYSGTNKQYTTSTLQPNGVYIAQVKTYDIAGNVSESTAETTIVDQTAPSIYNVVQNWFYNTQPYPIIQDENGDPIHVTLRKNGNNVLSWIQNSPYVIQLEGGEAEYTIIAKDTAGNSTWITFKIDTTAPIVNGIRPTTGIMITGSNSIYFQWTGYDTNISWFLFNLRSNSFGNYNTWIWTTNKEITIQNLNNGIYYRKVSAIDMAGNTTTTNTYDFTIKVPLTGQITISWALYNNKRYTNSWNIILLSNINKPTIATITGDIIGQYGSQVINKEVAAGNQTISIPASPGEWEKNIYVKLDDYLEGNSIYFTKTVIIDQSAPSKPVLTSINNQIYTGNATITRWASTDSWAWIKEYAYQIEQNNQIKKSWVVTSTTLLIQNMELGLQWTYNIKIKAIDNVGNSSERSEYAAFTQIGIPDTSPDLFSFSRQTNVERNKTYKSNTITIWGLSLNTSVVANIDKWKLFVNGSNAGDWYMVKNWDILYIELESSSSYDTTTASTLTIGDKLATFRITTATRYSYNDDDDDYDYEDLDDDEIDELERTYELINILDINLKIKFKDMLEDKIDELEDEWGNQREIEKLRYIYDRVVEDINGTSDSTYKAPNGKNYIIVYKKWVGYSSVNFSEKNRTKYFSTLDEIKTFIDKNNPKVSYKVDTSWKTSTYKAPNGKTYSIFKTTNGQYGSYNMVIPKLFTTLQELKNHINKNNPKK